VKDLGQCMRHPEEPALFRCRQCDDAACVKCRADGERDLCTVCGQYRQDSADRLARVAAGGEPDPAPRSIPWGRYLVAILVILNVALGAYLVLAIRPDNAVARGMAGVRTVAGVLEENRDPAGRYPPSLAPLLPRLPDHIAEMVRADVIRYETDTGRTEYRLSLVLRPRPPVGRRAD
jgi:hypothetical protein